MVEYTLLAFQNMIGCTRKDKIMHSKLDFRPVQIITDHVIYNSPYKYGPAENGHAGIFRFLMKGIFYHYVL